MHDPAELAGPLVAEALEIASAQHSFGRMIPLAVIEQTADVAAAMWDEAGVAPQPHAGMFRGAYVDVCPPGLGSELPPAGTPTMPLRAVTAEPAETTSRPLIYVTLGTVFSGPETYRLILSELADCDADVLLTTGRQNDPAELGPLPANARVERFIPQAEVLPRCALVITHCGSGSMLGALAHGLPLLALPNQADQFENAAAVGAAGAAEVLLPSELASETLRHKVTSLLADTRYREAARDLASEIAAMPSPTEVAEQLMLYAS